MAYGAFSKINAQFNLVFNEKGEGDCSTPVLYLSNSAELAKQNDQHPIRNQQSEIIWGHKMMMHGAEVSCNYSREVILMSYRFFHNLKLNLKHHILYHLR